MLDDEDFGSQQLSLGVRLKHVPLKSMMNPIQMGVEVATYIFVGKHHQTPSNLYTQP